MSESAFSDATDPAQLCDTCKRDQDVERSRGVFTVTSNITDRDDRERLLREAHESGKSFKMCARCALRPVMAQLSA